MAYQPKLGNYVSDSLVAGSAVALTTATAANVISITLTPGEWDVTGVVKYPMSGATAESFAQGISTTSATLGASPTYMEQVSNLAAVTSTLSAPTPVVHLVLTAASTTVYLVTSCTFSVGSVSAYGDIRAVQTKM